MSHSSACSESCNVQGTSVKWQAVSEDKQPDSLNCSPRLWPATEEVTKLDIDWQHIAGKQEDVTPFLHSTLTPQDRQIIEMDTMALLDLHSKDRFTSVEV